MHITNTQRAKRSEKHSEEQWSSCIFYDHFSRRSTTFCTAKKEKREGQSEKKESEVRVCVAVRFWPTTVIIHEGRRTELLSTL